VVSVEVILSNYYFLDESSGSHPKIISPHVSTTPGPVTPRLHDSITLSQFRSIAYSLSHTHANSLSFLPWRWWKLCEGISRSIDAGQYKSNVHYHSNCMRHSVCEHAGFTCWCQPCPELQSGCPLLIERASGCSLLVVSIALISKAVARCMLFAYP
jgi:hypothetical protein